MVVDTVAGYDPAGSKRRNFPRGQLAVPSSLEIEAVEHLRGRGTFPIIARSPVSVPFPRYNLWAGSWSVRPPNAAKLEQGIGPASCLPYSYVGRPASMRSLRGVGAPTMLCWLGRVSKIGTLV